MINIQLYRPDPAPIVDSKFECCPSANAVLENAGLAKRF